MRRVLIRGWSLVETLTGLTILGLLAAWSVDGLQGTQQRMHRLEARAQLWSLMSRQQEYRWSRSRFLALPEMPDAERPQSRHYSFEVRPSPQGDAAWIEAWAIGDSSRDSRCRYMAIALQGLDTSTVSGNSPQDLNDAGGNRQCWGS